MCECEYWKEDMKTTMEMAKEAGLIVDANQSGFDSVEAFAELVRAEAQAEEREACAKVCDARYMGDNNREDMEAKRCADDIRARGTND